jgi:putative membrane protein
VADFTALVPVALLAVCYALGLSRAADRPADIAFTGRGRRACAVGSLVALAVALGPPIDVWADTHLAAHMIQHVILLAIAPPLMVVGELPRIAIAGLPPSLETRVERVAARCSPAFRRVPLVAWIALAIGVQTTALGVWHLPSAYDAAVAHPLLHASEHASFLLAGFFFWWTVAGAGKRAGTATAVIAIFLASLPGTLLGAFMTLSTATWYPHYAAGSAAAALQDQELAGVVMWAGGGMAYVAAGAALFVGWLRELERESPSRALPPLLPSPEPGGLQ